MPRRPKQTTRRSINRRTVRRDGAERVLDRARQLPDAERALIEQVYRHGVSMAQVARLRREPVGRLRRRVARVVRRMHAPLFVFLLAHEALVPEASRQAARLIVFHGTSLRRTASATGVTLHRVREHMRRVRALASLHRKPEGEGDGRGD